MRRAGADHDEGTDALSAAMHPSVEICFAHEFMSVAEV
jgi:hypothetical protein